MMKADVGAETPLELDNVALLSRKYDLKIEPLYEMTLEDHKNLKIFLKKDFFLCLFMRIRKILSNLPLEELPSRHLLVQI